VVYAGSHRRWPSKLSGSVWPLSHFVDTDIIDQTIQSSLQNTRSADGIEFSTRTARFLNAVEKSLELAATFRRPSRMKWDFPPTARTIREIGFANRVSAGAHVPRSIPSAGGTLFTPVWVRNSRHSRRRSDLSQITNPELVKRKCVAVPTLTFPKYVSAPLPDRTQCAAPSVSHTKRRNLCRAFSSMMTARSGGMICQTLRESGTVG